MAAVARQFAAVRIPRHRSPSMEPLDHPSTAFNTSPEVETTHGRFHVIGPAGKDRDRMALQLETLGYVCEMSNTIETARTRNDEYRPDVLMISSEIKNRDTTRFIREIQAEHPSVRSVIFGAAPTPDALVEVIRNGASDWISLPTDRSRVPERMEQIMARVRAHRERECQLEQLADTCEQLTTARDEMSDQVNVLCGDLASAYRTMREQMSDVAMSSEFKALISQELDVEEMLRTSLEYILKKLGPTNAVVYLKEGDKQYGVGAYVNFQWQDTDLMPTLRDLGNLICPGMSTEHELVRFDDTAELAHDVGGHLSMLSGSQLASFSCHRDDECLAVFAFFRDADIGFSSEDATTLDVLRTIITEQLAQIIRVHKRSRPEWPDEPVEDSWGDLAA
jgi:DNA-binding response OmpR family regulator